MEENDEEDKDMRILRNECARLSEHFETVQIFVTRNQDDGTVNAQFGTGNWYSRYGQIKLWLLREERRTEMNLEREEE
jgi:hypothetical protein